MDLFDVMRTTFSCRQFTDDDVPDSALYEMFENARFARHGHRCSFRLHRSGGRIDRSGGAMVRAG